MASGAFAQGLLQFVRGQIAWQSDTIKAMLVKTGYTLNKNTQQFLSDVEASRYGGATDQTLGSKTEVIDTINNRVEISSGPTTWAALAQSASDDAIGVIGYKDTGTPSSSPLINFDDTNDVTPNGGDVVYTPNSEGILQLSYGP